MDFLWRSNSHFNLANLFTMVNITCGLLATYFITQNQFILAIILAWIGGAFDIFDGKIARKYGLSNEFGIQLDSFADFLSFVLVPTFLIFQAIFSTLEGLPLVAVAIGSVYYVISGLRRLIQFNINADAGEVTKYFTGVPTPLGAILLWLAYLAAPWITWMGVLVLMIFIGNLLNSRVKIPHP
ncbi:MAG TPA: CDP-alcohol phosphatidyltransferase family protein [Sulfuricurvum sp.]|nr:CDP-alcohol phosphatidyltransferase family protein [Sulfuricurvum sp.]